jgi:hypothetical protein
MLMGMLFFIYAIVGMQLFGSLVMDPSTAIGIHRFVPTLSQTKLELVFFLGFKKFLLSKLFDLY